MTFPSPRKTQALVATGFPELPGFDPLLPFADWAGCEVSCNACGQVCPTGAIPNLPKERKQREGRVRREGDVPGREADILPGLDGAGQFDADLRRRAIP